MNDQSKAWDRHAGTYARLGAPFTGYIAQSLFHAVAGRLPPKARILEVACGNGELSRAAALHCMAERAATGQSGSVLASRSDASTRQRVARRRLAWRATGGVTSKAAKVQPMGADEESSPEDGENNLRRFAAKLDEPRSTQRENARRSHHHGQNAPVSPVAQGQRSDRNQNRERNERHLELLVRENASRARRADEESPDGAVHCTHRRGDDAYLVHSFLQHGCIMRERASGDHLVPLVRLGFRHFRCQSAPIIHHRGRGRGR